MRAIRTAVIGRDAFSDDRAFAAPVCFAARRAPNPPHKTDQGRHYD